jgi:hypothetical protein
VSDKHPVIIVGAGLAGLAAAYTLHQANIPFMLLEQNSDIGGRVRTITKNGFRIDLGFQVLLTAYSELGNFFNVKKMDLCRFEPGAYVYDGHRLHEMTDPLRRPFTLLSALTSTLATVKDKAHLIRLRVRLKTQSETTIFKQESIPTHRFIRQWGFSEPFTNCFFKPFLGGIFSDPELITCSRLTCYYLKCFFSGDAAVCRNGMGCLSQHLNDQLPNDSVRCNATVTSIKSDHVTCHGNIMKASHVIDARSVSSLSNPVTQSVRCVHFAAPYLSLAAAKLVLNGTGKGAINHLAVMTDISPSYNVNEDERSLVSCSIIDHQQIDVSVNTIRSHCGQLLSITTTDWECVDDRHIKQVATTQHTGTNTPQVISKDGIWLAGDWTTQGSIQGALRSGRTVSESIINKMS